MSTYEIITEFFVDEFSDFEANDNEPSVVQQIQSALKTSDHTALQTLSQQINLSDADEFIGYEFGPFKWHPGFAAGAPDHAKILLDDGVIGEERYDALAKALRFSAEELAYLKAQAENEARGENGTAWFLGKLTEKEKTVYYAVSRSGHSWEGIRENFEGFYLSPKDIPDPWDDGGL